MIIGHPESALGNTNKNYFVKYMEIVHGRY